MRNRYFSALPLRALSPLLTAVLIACANESNESENNLEQHAEGGSGPSPSAGGTPGNDTSLGGAAGERDEPDGSGGVGGDSTTISGCGSSGVEAGTGGAGASSCINADGSCAEACHEVPIITGCGAEQERSTLCTLPPAPETTSCGVRLSDDRIFYVDAPYETVHYGAAANPFDSEAGFRPCTQAEVDASDCRDHEAESSARSVRFLLENTTAEDRWVLVEGKPCTAFDVKREGASLVRKAGTACEESACTNVTGDWVEAEIWQRVPAGEIVTFGWDGVELEAFQTIDVCEPALNEDEVEQPGDGRCIQTTERASSAGSYTATFAVRSTDPAMDDDAECEGERCSVSVDIVPVRATYGACEVWHGETLDVPFDLPETGEAVVNVALE